MNAAGEAVAGWTGRRALAVAGLAAAMLGGASALAFLCDDAYITFRHVANAVDGHGLVWNPPPFAPVEGCTSFLWAVLLWAAWAWAGVEPPDAAIPLAMALGVLTLGAVATALFSLRDRRGAPVPAAVALLALAVLVGNRTFLQWLSGGLETALFNLCFVVWVLLAFRAPARRGTTWWVAWSGAAALAELSRPDGMLLVAATAAVAGWQALARERRLVDLAAGVAPLLLVAAHLLGRRAFYGDWLPNTYYAKVTAPWPEAGLRYLYCYVVEHGTWVLVPVAGAWLWVAARAGWLPWRGLAGPHLPAVAALATTLAHAAYYVVQVGGDHFEYRVLSHWAPLAVAALLAMAAAAAGSARGPVLALLALAAAGSVGWWRAALTETLPVPYYDPLTPKLPGWLQPLTHRYDRYHMWLNFHLNCQRCEVHAASLRHTRSELPERARMARDEADLPVAKAMVVGLVGWVLPDVAVLDLLGLCDRTVARTPLPQTAGRLLPPDAMRAILAVADADGDGACTSAELREAIVRASGYDPAATGKLADAMVFMFGRERPGALTVAEQAQVVDFVAGIRFIAHEREAPKAYVDALDPNVTVEGRAVVVRKREVPLTAERVRAIEAEWRARVDAAR